MSPFYMLLGTFRAIQAKPNMAAPVERKTETCWKTLSMPD